MDNDINNLTFPELGRLFPIVITAYNPGWKAIYRKEKTKIIKAAGSENILGIEHIGSTAVPGLCAKPTIDILLEIQLNTDVSNLIENLENIKYQYIQKPENPPPHIMMAKGYSISGITGQTFHIHIRYKGDWDEILFRNYLTRKPEAAKQYAELKTELSARFKNDREKYTDSKGDFIKNIVKLARSGNRQRNNPQI